MNKGIVYLTTNIFDENFYGKSVYDEYVEDMKSFDEEPLEFDEWRYVTQSQEIDDFFSNIKHCDFGRVTIKGSVGSWDGRHEIMPVRCNSLYDAIMKCSDRQDDIVVTSFKTFVQVETYNHDSQYHGGNCFRLYTEKKRTDKYLF